MHRWGRLSLGLLASCSLVGVEVARDARAEEADWGTFEFALTLPVLYSSSVVGALDDAVVEDRPDWHADPDLTLEWEKQLSSVRLTLAAGAALERYAEVRDADLDAVAAGLTVELTDGASDLLVPFLEYEGAASFDPLFAHRTEKVHDVAIGFTTGLGFDTQGDRIPFDSADAPGSTALEFEVRAGRRFADPRSLERTFLEAGVEAERILSDTLSVAVESALKIRWYDERDRIDVKPAIELSLLWTPEWLTRSLPDAELALLFSWERNMSTLPSKSYTRWEGGPLVTLAYEF